MSGKYKDKVVTGGYYGELLALRQPTNERVKGHTLVECGCFGRELVDSNDLLSGGIVMCSYCRKTRSGENHGMSKGRTHRAWRAMKQRCNNPDSPMFPSYGGRGITVHVPWRESFKEFLSDMGDPPKGMTLERVDNDEGYSP